MTRPVQWRWFNDGRDMGLWVDVVMVKAIEVVRAAPNMLVLIDWDGFFMFRNDNGWLEFYVREP